MAKTSLNQNEIAVFRAMQKNTENNGGDFGFTDEIMVEGLTKHQIAGYIGQLQKKGLIDIYRDDYLADCFTIEEKE
jgi:hypothetical protein